MENKKCYWTHQNEGEFITECGFDYYFSHFDENDFPKGFCYCPYCGGKINFIQQQLSSLKDLSKCSHDIIYPCDGSTPQCKICGKKSGKLE